MATRPNLLLLFTDMQRWDTVRALGNPVIRTPHLDRLANEGAAFTSAYTPSPVCVSARYAMHYSRWATRSGVTENQGMPEDRGDSLPGRLAAAGYRTHAIGKLHFPGSPRELRGFRSRETQEEIISRPEHDDYISHLRANGFGHVHDPHGVRGEMYYVPQVAQMPEALHPSRWVGDRSVAFIEEAARAREPWMLMASWIHPHPPFAPPVPWHKLYRGFDMPLPSIPADAESLWTYINRVQNRYKYRDQGFDQHLVRLMKAYYYACISYVDAQIGRVLAALERAGQLDSTLIVFSSDHGEFLGDLGCFGKRSMHDASARVPLLARLPARFAASARVEAPASLVDVMPTMLAAAGVDRSGCDGEDLADVAAGRSRREHVFSQCGSGGMAQHLVVSRTWKYFHSAPDGRDFLFDRVVDPLETRNRAGLPSVREPLTRLRTALLAHVAAVGGEADLTVDAAGTRGWKAWPRLELPADPDSGLLMQDQPWAVNDIEGYTERQPAIAAWRVIGPFAATGPDERLLAQPTAIEAELRARGDGSVDVAARHADGVLAAAGSASSVAAAARAPLAWKAVSAQASGQVDLADALGALEHVIAYAYTELPSAEARDADLVLGSDDGVRVWFNGEEVLCHELQRGCQIGDERVRVRLRPGVNRLLLKVSNHIGGWAFGARLD